MLDNKDNEQEVNVENLWCQLGLSLPVAEGFASDIDMAARLFWSNGRKIAKLPAKERKAIYDKLDKAVRTLQEQLSKLPPSVEWELDEVGMGNEPEDYFESSLCTDHEGLTYTEFVMDGLNERLPNLQFLIAEAMEHHKQPRARPKQNEGLETAIQLLAKVFRHYTGREPMETYRYDEMDEERPYKSDFFDFLYAFFWVDESHRFPTSHTIGNATLRLFGLKK